MTRKDYELIANTIKGSYVERGDSKWSRFNSGVTYAALRMADRLAVDNPRFDRVRFLKACGVK